MNCQQNKGPLYMFLNHASQQFSPQTLNVPTVILLVEYQRTKIHHPHLLAFAPTFSCRICTYTCTDKYIHRYMIYPISFRMQLSQRVTLLSCFSPASSDPSACGFVCSSHCDAVHLWAEVIKVYAGATVAVANFILAQKVLFSFETGPILWSTIKFHISNFAGEKKNDLPHFILITGKICWGQSSSHATGRSCEVHHLSCLTWVYQLSYTVIFTAHVCLCTPTHFYYG